MRPTWADKGAGVVSAGCIDNTYMPAPLKNKWGKCREMTRNEVVVLPHKQATDLLAVTLGTQMPLPKQEVHELANIREKYSAPADIWALGVSVLEAAAGVFPFKAHQHNYMALLEQIVTCTDVPVDRVGPTLSPALKSMLNKCLRTDAAARPSSAQLLEEEFVTRAPITVSVRAGTLECMASVHAFSLHSAEYIHILQETKRLLVDLLRGLNFGGGARG